MSMTTPGALAAEFAAEAAMASTKAGNAVIKVAADIARDAKLGTPVDTGNLRASITRRTTRTATGAYAEVGPEANYGRFVEEGTYKMAAQPYLTPAAERNVEAFMEALSSIGDLDASVSVSTWDSSE